MLVQYQQLKAIQENVYENLKLEEVCMNMHISAYGRVYVSCEGFSQLAASAVSVHPN